MTVPDLQGVTTSANRNHNLLRRYFSEASEEALWRTAFFLEQQMALFIVKGHETQLVIDARIARVKEILSVEDLGRFEVKLRFRWDSDGENKIGE